MPLMPTVMPQEDQKIDNFGAPGIQIPKNAENIQAFKEVNDTDAKELNAKIQAQDEAKTQSTPGIQIPKDADKIDAFKHVSDVDPKTLNK